MNGEVMDHMENKICKRCQKKILKTEKAVLLKTFDNKKVYEELYFHLNCWTIDFNENAGNKAIELYTNSMKSSMGILQGIFKNGKEQNQSIVLQKGSGK